ICYIDEISDDNKIAQFILRPLLKSGNTHLPLAEAKTVSAWGAVFEAIVLGNSVLLIDGSDQAKIFGTNKYKNRTISEPATESLVRGPRDGFVESLKINLSLIRRRLRTADLRVRRLK